MVKRIEYNLNVRVPESIADLFINDVKKFVSVSSLDRFRVPYDELDEIYDFNLKFDAKSLDSADKIMRLCNRNHLLYGFTPRVVK